MINISDTYYIVIRNSCLRKGFFLWFVLFFINIFQFCIFTYRIINTFLQIGIHYYSKDDFYKKY